MSVAPEFPSPVPHARPALPTGRPPHLTLVHSRAAAPEPVDDNPEALPDAALFARIAAGGVRAVAARESLVARYEWLAASSARRYSGRGENDEELRQIAYVGLLEAISRFDPGRGIDFVYFARPTVLGVLRRHFRDGRRWVRVPRRLQELAAEVKEAHEDLVGANSRTPTRRELAEHVQAEEVEVAEALTADQFFAPASLDAPVSSADLGGMTLGDQLGGPDARLDLMTDWIALCPLIDALPERQREIIISIFWHDEKQADVGARLGISQMQVSRVLNRTLQELRAALVPA